MLIVTRHGMFSIVSTEEITEHNYMYQEEHLVEIRSMSADDIFSLVTDFNEIIGEFEVSTIDRAGTSTTDLFPSLLSSSRHKNGMMYSITVPYARWINLLACLGAGMTYTNFENELQSMIDDGERRANPLLMFIRSVYTMAVQVYSPFSIKTNSKGEVVH